MAVQSHELTSSGIASLVREPRLWVLLLISLLIQSAVIAIFSENLTDDRDAYLALSRQLANGNGFRISAEAPFTAYRPPLYPLLLSLPMRFLPEAVSVAGVNLLCLLLIVSLVWILSRTHWNHVWSTVATGLTVCNPLLLINTTLPMTELLFTALVLSTITIATRTKLSVLNRFSLGLLFGLTALCRPTVWAFGVITGVLWIVSQLLIPQEVFCLKKCFKIAFPVVASVVLVVSPWVIRNQIVFDAFIPMTTHGGYTLLLANNDVFYEEVVNQGWRTTWSSESLKSWQSDLSRAMNDSLPPGKGEVAQSRWMSERAQATIRNNPVLFLKSCGVRLLRFWNPVPLNTPDRHIPRIVQWVIGLFSSTIILGAFLSLLFSKRRTGLSQGLVVASWALIVSLTLVHTVYWSNARMRTPIEPLLVLLATSLISCRQSKDGPREQNEA